MVLETHGLTKRFRRRTAVDDLSLSVRKGDVYGFLGPNGAGKTTTLRMMVGLIRPTSGSVTILGEPFTSSKRKALYRIGAIIETPSFYTYLSGRTNLRMLASLSGGATPAKIDEVLERVDLTDRADDPVKIYSHGMKQRLAIAAALVPAPELILLDEPTNGLDPMGIRDVRALILSLANDDGLTVFLSSHLLSEIEQTCNRGAILVEGRKVWEGDVGELLAERRQIRLRARPADKVREVVARLGADIAASSADDPELIFLTASELETDVIVDALVKAECRVLEIAPHTPALEEVFIELVNRERNA